LPLVHQILKILVGRCDQPHVHLDRPRFANALELALLQDAQELDLDQGGISPTSSRKSVPPWAELEAPFAVRRCARECAFDVAKQLALDQALGQGGAVGFDERLVGAVAVVVDGVRDELLACTGLSFNQKPWCGSWTPVRSGSYTFASRASCR